MARRRADLTGRPHGGVVGRALAPSVRRLHGAAYRHERPANGQCGWGPGALRADPGTRRLRIDRDRCLLSARAPPGHTSRPSRRPPVAASAGPGSRWTTRDTRAARDPAAPRRRAPVPRPDVRWWTRPNLPASDARLSTATRPADRVAPAWSGPGWFVASDTAGPGDRRPVGRVDHSPGRTKIVRPPTTVRRQVGRSRPGVRSGRPGVPERGSVDQRATRSSGAWTTRSPVRQTA